LGLAAAPFVVGAGSLFGAENVNFSYTRLLHAAVPGQTDNMWFNFDLSPDNLEDRLPLELGLIVPKLTGHIAEQFVQFGSVPVAVFYWTFNLLTLVAVAALVRERDPLRVRLIVAALALVAIHLVTIVLFQNQFRYTVPALPGLLVVLAMVVSDWSWLDRFVSARPVFAVLVLALVATGPDLYLARDLRDDGQASADVEASVVAMFDRHLETNQPLLVVYVGPPQILVYAARPRPVLYLAAYYSRAEIDRLRRAFSADWLLAPSGSAVVTALGLASDSAVATVQALGEQWGLFELPPTTE
jgi:hypothetical protein